MTEMQIAYRNLQETRRHNRSLEKIEGDKARETARSNLAREAETNRTNVANEAIRRQANAINQSYYGAQVAEQHRSHLAQEALGVRNLAETVRSNVQRELETKRSNLAKEVETNRSNVAKEEETRRSNLVNESYTSSKLSRENQILDQNIKAAKIENKYREAKIINDMAQTTSRTVYNSTSSVNQLLSPVRDVVKLLK